MGSPSGESNSETGELIDILLVEPNHGDIRLFEENLEQGKIFNTIHTVSNGEAALDFVNQRGEYEEVPQPDLILLEPQLPGKSGMEVLSELNNEPELKEIPVIVLTSSEAGQEIVKSHGLEADEYIQKPVEAEEFVTFAKEVEDFWLAIIQDNGESDG
ncbi:response regulator [Natronococcus sp. A-GB1]|uniref:response regulator n=1 Tax=Natronococcus sp. A-GB1 TaxID=3037648 RepID=UPI00241C29F9|nr:response regulator [Natronococcus sp. A-GB1]MDG5761944.1 response regulator [Natronococcus sp. A-GB1]